MIKIGAVNSYNQGRLWDEKGHSKISQIYISYDEQLIHSIQFQHIENGTLVLSPLYGSSNGLKFFVVTLDLSNEFVTGISGYCSGFGRKITSLTFITNRQNYGPFGSAGSSNDQAFEFRCGGEEHLFGGFHGSCDGMRLTSIGIYVIPRRLTGPTELNLEGGERKF